MCFVLDVNDPLCLWNPDSQTLSLCTRGPLKKHLSASRCEPCHPCVDECYMSSLTQHIDLCSFFLPVVLSGGAQICGGMQKQDRLVQALRVSLFLALVGV